MGGHVPKALRLRLARDPGWTTWVGNLAVRAIGAWQRRIARQRGLRAPRTGAITFVPRFGGLVNLNVHFHLLVPDGVFVDDDDRLAFAPRRSHDRLAWTADGQIAYRRKRPWPDGRTELVLPPVTFLRRLCGIIPPPRRHLVRYAGVFGPASQRRAQLRTLVPARGGESPLAAATPSGSPRAGRVPWAELVRRVFATDVLSCPCGGRRSVIAVVVDSALARAVLAALGAAVHAGDVRACAGPAAARALVRRRFVARTTPDAPGRGRICPDLDPMYAR